VEETTVVHGEDFIVEVTLKNNSGEDTAMAYWWLNPIAPHIDGWHFGFFPPKDP